MTLGGVSRGGATFGSTKNSRLTGLAVINKEALIFRTAVVIEKIPKIRTRGTGDDTQWSTETTFEGSRNGARAGMRREVVILH